MAPHRRRPRDGRRQRLGYLVLEHRLAGIVDNGRFTVVHCDDLARSPGAPLVGDRHPGKTYNLTRPEALTLAEAAEVMCGQYDNPWLTCAKRWPASCPTTCTTRRTSAIVTKATP
jgi:hypothetical protein